VKLYEEPLSFTTIGPLVAPAGTGTIIVSVPQLVGVAVTPLKVTVPGAPKPIPLIVTFDPTGPEDGLTAVISAYAGTVKLTELLILLPTAITTGPVVAPIGIITWMEFGVHPMIVAGLPSKVTEPPLELLPKFVPKIVAIPRGRPLAGAMLEIHGTPNGVVPDVLAA
jgi:hypothetical protein